MSTEFCVKCGNRMEYSFAPPNFCSKCGTNIKGGVVAAASTNPQQPLSVEETMDEEVVPILDSLQYDISYGGGISKVLKFEELATQQPSTSSKRRPAKRKKGSKADKGAFLKESIDSCKSIGNRSQEIGGAEKTK